MSQGQASAQPSETALADEVKEQRARIQALEEQLARRDEPHGDTRSGSRQLVDLIRELSEQRDRDASAFGRALMLGSLDHLKSTARVVTDFVNRVEKRDKSVDDATRRPAQLADEVLDELLAAARESAAVQTQSVERVLKEYRDQSAAKPQAVRT
jgi:hypothetical protein